MIERTVAIIENADAVPQLGILFGVGKKVERLLIGRVCLLQVVLHQIAMAKCTPYFTIIFLQREYALKVFNGLGIIFLDPSNACNLSKARQTHRIVPKGVFIRVERLLQVVHLLRYSAYEEPCLFICEVEFVNDVGIVGRGGR